MFLLGVLAHDWRPKKNSTLSDAAKVHIYSPDQEDCLLFHYEFTGRIKVNQIICQLTAEGGAISYVEDDFYLKIRPRKKILGKQITPNFFAVDRFTLQILANKSGGV